MEILIISGLSGGGKSKAASFLEDMGFYIVDNMPAAMILKFAEFCAGGGGRYDRVALVYDVRTATSFTELFDVLDQLKTMECECRRPRRRWSFSVIRRPGAAILCWAGQTRWKRRFARNGY